VRRLHLGDERAIGFHSLGGILDGGYIWCNAVQREEGEKKQKKQTNKQTTNEVGVRREREVRMRRKTRWTKRGRENNKSVNEQQQPDKTPTQQFHEGFIKVKREQRFGKIIEEVLESTGHRVNGWLQLDQIKFFGLVLFI
jgi:hypothetical protein